MHDEPSQFSNRLKSISLGNITGNQRGELVAIEEWIYPPPRTCGFELIRLTDDHPISHLVGQVSTMFILCLTHGMESRYKKGVYEAIVFLS